MFSFGSKLLFFNQILIVTFDGFRLRNVIGPGHCRSDVVIRLAVDRNTNSFKNKWQYEYNSLLIELDILSN